MHKRGHAFTYLLLKGSVSNDVINVSLYAFAYYDEISIDPLRRSRPTPGFIAPDMWPPNSRDLNPVDYSVWSVMQQRVYHSRVKDVDELREHLISVWCELDQSVVKHAIDEWRIRPLACIDAEGGHFEHYLRLILSK